MFIETSAKTGYNVKQVRARLAMSLTRPGLEALTGTFPSSSWLVTRLGQPASTCTCFSEQSGMTLTSGLVKQVMWRSHQLGSPADTLSH